MIASIVAQSIFYVIPLPSRSPLPTSPSTPLPASPFFCPSRSARDRACRFPPRPRI